MKAAIQNACCRRPQRRRGVAAVEFAVCLPLLVLLFISMTECCTMIFLKQSLTIASYEGMRKALQGGTSLEAVDRTCQNILENRNVKGYTISVSPDDWQDLRPGEYFTVTASAPTAPNGVLPIRLFRGMTLSGAATMMKEL